MSGTNGHPLDLILGYEELDHDERARADAHLAGCEPCRRLLDDCGAAESRGVDAIAIDLDDPLAGHDPSVRADADASRAELLARLPAGSTSVAWWRRGDTAMGLLALAAVLVALVVFGPWTADDGAPFEGLRLAPSVVARDEGVHLEPGDPFSIRFVPAADGWPVVVRVGGDGAELVCPTPDLEGWRVRAERPAVIPPPGAGVEWTLPAGADGRWLVALSADPVADPAALAAELAASDNPLDLLQGRFGRAAEVP